MKKYFLSFCLMVLCVGSIMATGTTGLITGNATLANGHIYTVPNSITINATGSAAGLTVADNATVTIYIPKNVTLTVNGNGRFAGIYIPLTSVLIITGEGTLNAKGGNNTNGANGGSGGAAAVWTGSTWASGNYGHESAGNGGTGGAGGNGGGAGIGGNGGAGGAAKAGPTGVKDRECWIDNNLGGKAAYAGNNGGSGSSMGWLFVMGNVKVNSTKGTQSSPTVYVGADGANATMKWNNRWSAGGGGGGGCGGHGYIAPYGIGGGGAGGGSGASGATGGFLWSKAENNNTWNAVGCYGGRGGGYNCTRGNGSWRSQSGYKNDYWNGGASAWGGTNGSNGENGTVFKVEVASYSAPSVTGASALTNIDYYPAQVKATLSFNANGGNGAEGDRTVYYGVKMDNVSVPTREGYKFVGYFTTATGGTKVFNSDGTPVSVSTIAANTTLYAHYVSIKHTVTWDYTYRTGEDTYANLDQSAHAPYCRLQIKNASGVIKTVYLTAPSVTNKETTLTSDISTHTTASTTVNFAVGNSANVTSGETATIYFTQAELESIHECNYEVWSNTAAGGSVVEHWVTETNLAESTTLFKWEGYTGDNMFDLKWTVTLKGLNMYPDKIFVKPMVDTGEGYRQITPMNGLIGEECEMVTLTKNSNDELGEGSSATYTGEYVVLKNVSVHTNVPYQVGMTGFYLNGQEYFLNAERGTVAPDFVSNGTAATAASATISYEINDYDIPAVLLLPAAPGSGITGATVNGLDMELYVDQDRTTTVNLSRFKAERPNFTFLGWFDKEWNNTTWAADAEYEFHTHDASHNGGTRTLVALWQRDSEPEASIEMTEEATQFKYTITATDNVEVKAVKYLISDAEVTAETGGWTTLTATDGKYVVTIPRDNTYRGQSLYVMVENEGLNVVVKCEEPIRSYYTVSANPDPDSYDTEEFANGTWSEPTEEGGESTFTPDGTKTTINYYDYYSTFYYGNRSFKLFDASAYTATIDETKLELHKIAPAEEDEPVVIPAGTAVILRKEHAEENDDTIELEECATPEQSSLVNSLEGRDTDDTQDAYFYYYIFTYAQHGLGFYLNNENRKLAAHKAYIQLDAEQSSGVSAFILDFNESIVEAIREIETTGKTSVTIDLSGRKVMDGGMHGGIYMKGSSKLLK